MKEGNVADARSKDPGSVAGDLEECRRTDSEVRLWSEAGAEGRVGGDGICLRVLGVVKMGFMWSV